MSRPIKFRAWDRATNEMHICGELIHDRLITDRSGNVSYYNMQNGEGSGEYGDYVLMQYAGMQDRDGKELYEGDIVIAADFLRETTTPFKALVEWDRYRFILRNLEQASPIFGLFNHNCDPTGLSIEVIGNRWEHPHLLKGEDADGKV